ncbi:unnamed protein product [Gongylonema pulchrum]|uniref:C2H2-type domain-containing protein n=1 Tax=Gongylonema pulchrum TaxID=637853 RepID=A0A183E0Q9_9BILA|nr:unnamed protein product [Gongylonema pulchrum]
MRWKKRYLCLFSGCNIRFFSRNECQEHILSHFPESGEKNRVGKNGTTKTEAKIAVSDFMGVEEKQVVRHAENGANKKEQERNSHTTGSTSPDSDAVPEGYGLPSATSKPYTVQTFLMREQAAPPLNAPSSGSGAVFFNEMVAHLPVRNTVHEAVRVNIELIPTSQQNSPVLHL